MCRFICKVILVRLFGFVGRIIDVFRRRGFGLVVVVVRSYVFFIFIIVVIVEGFRVAGFAFGGFLGNGIVGFLFIL